ncbi:MAG: DUF853 family protein [Peptococcaceae bacterium]|nr:DUF853 family protein [Peptococcaceae bacterium]
MPEKQNSGQDEIAVALGYLVVAGVVALSLLPAVPFFLVFLALWKIIRLKWWHLAVPGFLIFALMVATDTAGQLLDGYFNALKEAFYAYRENRFTLAGLPWKQAFPIAALAGLGCAAIIAVLTEVGCSYTSFDIKKKNDLPRDRKPGPLASWREKRALGKIAAASQPDNGVLLGLNRQTRRPVVLTDTELNQHCLIFGTTGSGKTTTIMNMVESAISRRIPLVLVDGKGASDLGEKAKFLADRYGQPFYLFTMRGESWHYNPLTRGGITGLKDKLISLTEWTEEHYKKMAERYLQLVFRCFAAAGEKVDLINVARYLDPDALVLLARGISDAEERNRILNALESFKDPEIRGLAARIAVMTESEIGHLFRDDEKGKTIDLGRAIEENAVVVFLMDSLSFPEYSRLLGRLVVTDLKSVAARQFSDGRKKIYAVFDEFNIFASSAVVDLIGKTRSFGFHVLIGTQSPSDLERAGGGALVEQVVENCNSYIIHRQNSALNAEKLASVIGTDDSYELTYQVQERGIFFSGRTGLGSMRQIREFIVHPDEIKRLGTGEAILVQKTDGFRVVKIKVRRPYI